MGFQHPLPGGGMSGRKLDRRSPESYKRAEDRMAEDLERIAEVIGYLIAGVAACAVLLLVIAVGIMLRVFGVGG